MKKGTWFVTVSMYMLIIGCFLAGTYFASVATSTVAQLIPVEREATIIIDAGHGGVDGGATSCTGVLESKINLDICLKLEDMLHLLGYKTVMIRRTDISVYTSGDTIAAKKVSDLRQRVKIVSDSEDPILISIHQNTYPDGRYAGAQVFYANNQQSRELAEIMQLNLVRSVNPGSNRSCKKAEGIYLMQHVDCPAILVECGFLSNPEEEAQLRSDAYQKKLCCVIGSALGQFLTK